MASFLFELVSPERLLFAGDVEEVVVPGTEGEFTVLKDHAPLMSTLRPGVVTMAEAGGKRSRLFVDSRLSALKEPGDILIPLEEGAITPDHIVAEHSRQQPRHRLDDHQSGHLAAVQDVVADAELVDG